MSASEPVPAAAVILLRDAAPGLEVLMQQRREQVGAFAGVLAFPGGKVAAVDRDPRFLARADLGGESPFEPARRLAALRELFEECGILLARGPGAALAARDALLPERERLDRDPAAWPVALAALDLRLAADLLAPWARWITPEFAPKRFDSTMFVAEAPAGQAAIGGREADEYVWARPSDLIADAERGARQIVFVTRMNLLRLALHRTVADVMAAARRGPHDPIRPWRAETPDGPVIRIAADAPYPVHEMPFAASSVAIELKRLARKSQNTQ